MGYSFYGGRKGNGWSFATSSAPSGNFYVLDTIPEGGHPTSAQVGDIENVENDVNYGEFFIVNSQYIFQRVLADSYEAEWVYIATISTGSVTVNYLLDQEFETTVMRDYKNN